MTHFAQSQLAKHMQNSALKQVKAKANLPQEAHLILIYKHGQNMPN